MDDIISRQAVKELAHKQMREKYCGTALKEQRDFYIKLADSIIDLLPSAEPQESKGKWINGKCNRCGEHALFWAMASTYHCSNYCPNCGCKMEVDNEAD